MTSPATDAASTEDARETLVGLGRGTKRSVALAGNPNTGKSTLFNALTGLRQKVANYPGITVDVHIGSFPTDGPWIELLDLPGIYSLAAHSPDERLALDVLLGRTGDGQPDAVLLVATTMRAQPASPPGTPASARTAQPSRAQRSSAG